MPLRTALVVGGTGLVGGHCLSALLDDPDYGDVVALGRRLISREHPKLRQGVIDFDRLDRHRHLSAADDVFCCLGTTIRKAGSRDAFRKVDFSYPIAIAEAALASGARQFLVVSALGANSRARAFYSHVKGDMEEAVARLPFHAVHIFRPSLLVGHRDEVRPAERLALLVSLPLSFGLIGPLRRFRPIEAARVASCMVTTAKQDRAGVHVFESEQIAG